MRTTKNQKTTVCHIDFTEKVYGLPCIVCMATATMRKYRRETVVNGAP